LQSDVWEKSSLSSPPLKGGPETAEKVGKGRICLACTVEVHGADNVLGKFHTARQRIDASDTHRLAEAMVVTVEVAFLVGRLTAVIEHCLERMRIDQQPALDVRIRDRWNHQALIVSHGLGDFLDPRRMALAIGIAGNNE